MRYGSNRQYYGSNRVDCGAVNVVSIFIAGIIGYDGKRATDDEPE